MHIGGHQLEECGFPNVVEANGLRLTSKLSRARWGDYERNGDVTPTDDLELLGGESLRRISFIPARPCVRRVISLTRTYVCESMGWTKTQVSFSRAL